MEIFPKIIFNEKVFRLFTLRYERVSGMSRRVAKLFLVLLQLEQVQMEKILIFMKNNMGKRDVVVVSNCAEGKKSFSFQFVARAPSTAISHVRKL